MYKGSMVKEHIKEIFAEIDIFLWAKVWLLTANSTQHVGVNK